MHNHSKSQLNPDILFSILEIIGMGALCLIAGICFERLNYVRCCRPSAVSVV